MRAGAGINHSVLGSLAPGSEVAVIAGNEAGDWIEVRLADGRTGWISAPLLQLDEAETSPADAPVEAGVALAPQLVTNLPVVDVDALRLTATALIQLSEEAHAASLPTVAATSTPTVISTAQPSAPVAGVDVFAFCNNQSYGIAAPSSLAAGSTIEIFWAWFAESDAYLRQHIANATHELRVNGTRISDVDAFRGAPRQQRGQHVVYWYVPYGPLAAGDYRITYRVTWRQAISDGYASYGPGTANEVEEESCSFVVR